jgi:quinol monooxygenase YgiN
MVVLINTFEVEPTNADAFLAAWKRVSAVMERRSGFLRTRLHRALAGSRFVNVGEWENQSAFESALGSNEFQEVARGLAGLATMSPALYEVVYEAVDGHPADA